MNKTFTDLINNDLVIVDERLITAFNKMILLVEKYFQNNKIFSDEELNYRINDFMLGRGGLKVEIIDPNSIDAPDGASKTLGIYNDHHIYVREDILDDEETLIHVLCHEFIHFVEGSYAHVLYGETHNSFIKEGITELIATSICGNDIGSYSAITRMMNFGMMISDDNLVLEEFFSGSINSCLNSTFNFRFKKYASDYKREFENTGYIIEEAHLSENYLKAQRELIERKIDINTIFSFEELKKVFEILDNRPTSDNKWINRYYETIISTYVKNLNLTSEEEKEYFETLMKYVKIKNLLYARKTYGENSYSFNVGDNVMTMSGNEVHGLDRETMEYWFVSNDGIEFIDKKSKEKYVLYPSKVNGVTQGIELNKLLIELENILKTFDSKRETPPKNTL